MSKFRKPLFSKEFCKNWDGMTYVTESLRKSGHKIPYIFQKEIICYCESDRKTIGILDYWAEVSKEYISSGALGGGGADRGRFRHLEKFYNSEELCNLEKIMINKLPENGNNYAKSRPVCHECIRKFQNEWDSQSEIRDGILKKIGDSIISEKLFFETQFHDLPSKNIKILFEIIGKELSFYKAPHSIIRNSHTQNIFHLSLENGLLFYTYIDKITEPGDRRLGYINAPLAVGYKSIDMHNDQQLGDMSIIVPGIDLYSNNITEDGFALSFHAYFACAFAISQSFSGWSRD